MIATLLLLSALATEGAPSPEATPSPSPAASPEVSATPAETPAPTPAQTPAATPAATAVPAPAPASFFAAHVTQWPGELTLSWTQGLAKRTAHTALDAPHGALAEEYGVTAAGEYSPIRGLAIAGDLVVDSTKTIIVSAGGQGCSDYTQQSVGTRCSTFANDDVIYLTETYFMSLRAKPYLTFGPFRAFASVGIGYGNIDTNYSKSAFVTDQSWGRTSATLFAPSAQIGGEYAYKLAPNGACFVIEAAVTAGAPSYGETIGGLFYANHTWHNSNVGTGLNPLRGTIGIGFSFPTEHPPGG